MNEPQRIKKVFHVHHQGDTFEVALRGFVIARITCYHGGSVRQDVQYDDLPLEVQDRILDHIRTQL